ncbi:hypothetical protein MJO29_011116 [Puccinia striiformis f. sp. tritici]|uniref:hypothetical protein n=2 Tax=Puccinia striiformis f. sp. tritici TaxID=168172 RepID=UPI0020074713|nr:hypothetical protein Pst134EA_021018 [Puccinia striiformis f. sp. tritici]KAH9457123.1 hypothetical protein Pst134EA_021018 [Puccinia striiformis f. sp. tritici]KAI7946589.1 hypothetical protein MJO29_011116 [Puccinia striiformis f. sp. tritici]
MACMSHRPLIITSSPSASLPAYRLPTSFHRHPVYRIRGFTSLQDGGSRSTKSYLTGPTTPPLFEDDLASHWTKHILPCFHDRPALIARAEPPSPTHQPGQSGCLRLNYSQLDQSINSMALALLQLGIRKGDRVGINTPNHSIYPILQWATSKIGAILATINPAYAPSELANVLKRVDCKVLFSTPSIKSKDMVPILSTLIQEIPSLTKLIIVDNESHKSGQRSKSEIFQKFDSIRSAVTSSSSSSSVIDLDQVIDRTVPQSFPELEADEVINLQFTSGTTGLPKAVSLTHRNLLNNAHHIADRINLTSKDSLCNVPPMFHCFGSVIGNLATFVKGATVVIPSESFDPHAVIKTISEERCTVLNGVGTMFLAELNELDRMKDIDLSSLRTGVVAGSPVSAELMNRIEDRLGIKELTILYGMTETSPGTFQTRATDERSKRTTTVGTIYPHTRAKVVDLMSREIVERGERGELLVSGYSVQKGYWNDPVETAKAMITDSEGLVWMQSGDIACIDADGYLKIVGRAKEVIIRGGENLYPVVIENCIIKLDGVVSVAVVAAKDEFYGEVVCAFVKRNVSASSPSSSTTTTEKRGANMSEQQSVLVTEDDIRAIVKKNMAGANIPKYVWFLDSIDQVDFPMTGSGKIKKTELALWVTDLLNQNQS